MDSVERKNLFSDYACCFNLMVLLDCSCRKIRTNKSMVDALWHVVTCRVSFCFQKFAMCYVAIPNT